MSILLNELRNRRERLGRLSIELRIAAETGDLDQVYQLAFRVSTLADAVVEKSERLCGEYVQSPLPIEYLAVPEPSGAATEAVSEVHDAAA